MVKNIVKVKTRTFDENEDKDKDEGEDYNFNNGREIRQEPRRTCNKSKFIKPIIDFDINKFTCKDCDARRLNANIVVLLLVLVCWGVI